MSSSASPVNHSPFWLMYTGITSYFSRFTFRINCTALMMLTSCSQVRLPKITPNWILLIYKPSK